VKTWQANSIFILIAIFWGLGFPLVKEGLQYVGPISIIFARFLVASVIVSLFRPQALFRITKKEWIAGAGIGFCLAAGFIVQTIGLETTSSGKTGFITSLNILIVPIVTAIIFGQEILKKNKIAIAIAIIGFGFLSSRSFTEGLAVGDLWVLGCAFFFAFQIVGIDQFTAKLNGYRVNLVQMWTGTILCGFLAFVIEDSSLHDYRLAWFWIVSTGVLSVAFPFLAQLYAQRATTPTAAALLMSLEAVFAVIFGWMLHTETLSTNEYLGCGLIMVATSLILIPNERFKKYFERREAV
jgi:drug/metabolite transporter (DMT)-like permease